MRQYDALRYQEVNNNVWLSDAVGSSTSLVSRSIAGTVGGIAGIAQGLAAMTSAASALAFGGIDQATIH